MNEAVAAAGVIAFLVLGLVELVKQMKPPKWTRPLFALLFGVGIAFLTAWADVVDEMDLDRPGFLILVGLIAGLTAAGIHSATGTVTSRD